jgi:hypothetical protein
MATTSAQYRTRAFLLLIPFFLVFAAIFMPWYPGPHGGKVNGLDYLDNFFNELSKGSAYYVDRQKEKVAKYNGQNFSTTMTMNSVDEATTTAKLFNTNNIPATIDGSSVSISGDFGAMLTTMLDDADLMYKNDGAAVTQKYGINERKALNSWYKSLGAMEKDLNKAKEFEKAKVVKNAMTKAIEPAYNYYGVQAKPVKDEVVLLIFALTFYVVYTVWYGFGVLFLFEGMGIRLEH